LPDDYGLKYFDKVVTIGDYQHLSNYFLNTKLLKIRNLFYRPKPDLVAHGETYPSPHDVVYLGGLVSGKGFHKTIPFFAELSKYEPRLKFHVIGSSGTYSGDENKNEIPADPAYAEEIDTLARKYSVRDKMIFYGNLGIEKYQIMRKCRFALINPTGKTEAFPASVLELMSAGCVVFAGSDFGLNDVMSAYVPNSVQWEASLVNRYKYYQDDSNYKRYLDYSRLHLDAVTSENGAIINRWIMLLGYPEISMMPDAISRKMLIFRYLVQYLKIVARKIHAWE
jgi:hypothetical protein